MRGRSRGRHHIRRQLRHEDVAQPPAERHAVGQRQLVVVAGKTAHTLTDGDDHQRDLVDDDRKDQGEFGQPEPDIERDGDHHRRHIQPDDHPGGEQPIGNADAAQDDADDTADRHGDNERDGGAAQRLAHVGQQLARDEERPHLLGDGDRRRKQVVGKHHRRDLPNEQQQQRADQFPGDIAARADGDGLRPDGRAGTVRRMVYFW